MFKIRIKNKGDLMKVLPMNNYQYNNNFKANTAAAKATTRVAEEIVQDTVATESGGHGRLLFGIFAAMSLAIGSLFCSCSKDNSTQQTTSENRDLVDMAFKNVVNFFNLDTIGQTKILKYLYPLNGGDSIVEHFAPQTDPEVMHSQGIYYYNGTDPFMPREQPFEGTWTKTLYEGRPAIKAEYKHPWENRSGNMPEPQEVYFELNETSDNTMKMHIHPGTGICMVDVDSNGNTIHYQLEDSINFDNPFGVKIKENY